MPRLDVHLMPGNGRVGYVVNVQADLLTHLATRTVVPLLSESTAPKPIIEQTQHYNSPNQACGNLQSVPPAASRSASARSACVFTLKNGSKPLIGHSTTAGLWRRT